MQVVAGMARNYGRWYAPQGSCELSASPKLSEPALLGAPEETAGRVNYNVPRPRDVWGDFEKCGVSAPAAPSVHDSCGPSRIPRLQNEPIFLGPIPGPNTGNEGESGGTFGPHITVSH